LKKILVLITCILFSGNAVAQTEKVKIVLYKDLSLNTVEDSLFIKKAPANKMSSIVDSIKNSYLLKGYLNLISNDNLRLRNEDRINIHLGRRFTKIKIIDQSHSGSIDNLNSSLSRKRDTYIDPVNLESYLASLQDKLSEKGLPFARIETTQWDFQKIDTALLFIRTLNMQQRSIDRIVVNGYPQYPKNIINSLINKSSIYNSKNIEKIDTKIRSLKYFETVKESEALFKKDSTLLYVYVRKKDANSADGLMSFNTDDNGKVKLNGFLDATLHNNLNFGERFDFEYRNDDNKQTSLDLKLQVPGIILKKIGLSGNFNITRRDSTYQNSHFRIGMNYPITNNLSSQVGYYNKNSTEDGSLNFINDFNTKGIVVGLNYSGNLRSTLQPESLSFSLEAGLYQRTLNNEANSQYSLDIELEKLWTITKRISLLTNAKAYLLKTAGLQFNELTQIGGTKSIRGFNQNSIDTAAFSLLQTDVRYAFNDQFYINLVNDTGVFEEYTDREAQYLYSFGAGIGILTNAGILRLQVINGRIINSKQSVSSTIAHLNFTILF